MGKSITVKCGGDSYDVMRHGMQSVDIQRSSATASSLGNGIGLLYNVSPSVHYLLKSVQEKVNHTLGRISLPSSLECPMGSIQLTGPAYHPHRTWFQGSHLETHCLSGSRESSIRLHAGTGSLGQRHECRLQIQFFFGKPFQINIILNQQLGQV